MFFGKSPCCANMYCRGWSIHCRKRSLYYGKASKGWKKVIPGLEKLSHRNRTCCAPMRAFIMAGEGSMPAGKCNRFSLSGVRNYKSCPADIAGRMAGCVENAAFFLYLDDLSDGSSCRTIFSGEEWKVEKSSAGYSGAGNGSLLYLENENVLSGGRTLFI